MEKRYCGECDSFCVDNYFGQAKPTEYCNHSSNLKDNYKYPKSIRLQSPEEKNKENNCTFFYKKPFWKMQGEL